MLLHVDQHVDQHVALFWRVSPAIVRFFFSAADRRDLSAQRGKVFRPQKNNNRKKIKTPTQLRDFKSFVLGRVTKADKSQTARSRG